MNCSFIMKSLLCKLYKYTRTKTSIRYAKENDREKRERRREKERRRERDKGRRRDIEREGEIRERERDVRDI